MDIAHGKEIKEAIHRLVEAMDLNEFNANAFNDYLSSRNKAMFSSCEKAYKNGREAKKAFLQESKKCLMKCGIGNFIDETRNDVIVLDSFEYEKDPYWQTINFPDIALGDWKLRTSFYEPFEGMLSDEIRVKENEYYKEINQFGFFLKRFRYIEVIQNDKTWMSVTPHEINTMKDDINKSRGRVITFGLGLGYYPFSVSLKENVESITIVEKDEKCIELFDKFIFPQFQSKTKISIIKSDAYEFAEAMKDGDFDYAFADIWHLPFDGLFSYLRFVPLFSSFKKTETSYWIEKSILSLLRRALIILIDEEYKGSTDENYRRSKNETDSLINALHFSLKKVKIKSVPELLSILSDENLRSLAAKKLV